MLSLKRHRRFGEGNMEEQLLEAERAVLVQKINTTLKVKVRTKAYPTTGTRRGTTTTDITKFLFM